jgi:hypothetical protein
MKNKVVDFNLDFRNQYSFEFGDEMSQGDLWLVEILLCDVIYEILWDTVGDTIRESLNGQPRYTIRQYNEVLGKVV